MKYLEICLIILSAYPALGRLNFLLIVVDDLRPSLGCYGDKNAYTPNIDRLAKSSAIFTNAFAQQSLCAPSRNSFLTGHSPETLQLYDFYSYWRDVVGNFTTLPQHLKNHGYKTMSIGKVFHPGKSSNGSDDYPYSWSKKPFHPYTERYKNARQCRETPNSFPAKNLICPVMVNLMPNETLPDIESLEAAKVFINRQKDRKRPFFLAVGFHKPHIPLKFPQEYLRFHPLKKFALPNSYKWNDNVSHVAYNPWIDLRKRDDVMALNLKFPWEKIPDHFGRKIIQSYYAAVSYVDHLVGELVNELHRAKVDDETVIIFMADHGWSMGEHSEWSKFSNFEVSLKVPLMISIPSATTIASSKAAPIHSIVELLDVFPTVAELADIPIPMCSKSNKVQDYLNTKSSKLCSEGRSLVPLITAAFNKKKTSWKNVAFSQYPRPGIEPTWHPNSDRPRLEEIKIMGYTVRTERFRYTAWVSFDWENNKPNWDELVAEELYDYRLETNEDTNVAHSSKYFQQKLKLQKLLRCGWRCK